MHPHADGFVGVSSLGLGVDRNEEDVPADPRYFAELEEDTLAPTGKYFFRHCCHSYCLRCGPKHHVLSGSPGASTYKDSIAPQARSNSQEHSRNIRAIVESHFASRFE